MTTPSRPPVPPSGTTSGQRLGYDSIRDSFLAELPATAEEELHYFTRIGMFVFGRWQAIADDHGPDEPIDEGAHDARWSECTERDIAGIQRRARLLIDGEIGRLRAVAFVEAWSKSVEPIKAVTRGLSWVLMRAWEHFIGAIGLLCFGLLLVWVAPSVAKTIRSAFDETLPAATRPDPTDRPAQIARPRDGGTAGH